MPRLPPGLLRRMSRVDPLLPLVLQGTRDVGAAKNELRWLREFVAEQQQNHRQSNASDLDNVRWQRRLRQLCIERARGKPLQYILGTEYFGDLEIACEPGVLIPRQETAASVTHLVRRLNSRGALPEQLRVLDLCTGTGCIPLLVSYEFLQTHRRKKGLEVLGVDLSSRALSLARRNLHTLSSDGTLHVGSSSHSLRFLQADVLTNDDLEQALRDHDNTINTHHRNHRWDILISNPPYISPEAFNHTTTRSVKRFEPKLALVPKASFPRSNLQIDPGDTFYPRLLEVAKQIDAQAILFEVADFEQASRVAAMLQDQTIWSGIEIWRDDPTHADGEITPGNSCAPTGVKVVGSGNGRSVFAWRDDANAWLDDASPS